MKKEFPSVFIVFLIYTALLVYLSLTVINISDRQIIIDRAVTLPILNVDIALNGFFISVPMITILFFVCFQLYFYKLKAFIEAPESGLIGKLQRIMLAFFLWATLPLFLILVAFKYVKTHEPFLSYVIGSTPIVGILVVLGFWRNIEKSRRKKFFRRKILCAVSILSVITIELALLLFLIPRAREGVFPRIFRGNLENFLKHIAVVNLSHQRLITKPEEDHKNLSWGNFKEIHMEGADLRHSMLKRANLKSAFLQNSRMEYAVLEDADLSFANLSQVNFRSADLRGANLFHAYLLGASLRKANFQKAYLRGADLRYVRFFQANFQEADLSLVDTQYADLFKANFQGANFFHASLQEIKLSKSNLAEANFKGANLQGATLWKTNLRGANFEEADLRKVRDLEIKQLAEVKTLYNARLDPELLQQIKKKYPHFLEKPEKKE